MSINLDHNFSGAVTLATQENSESTIIFPSNVSGEVLISGKSNATYISGLQDNFTTVFYELNLINSAHTYSYSNDCNSSTQNTGSVVFGQAGKAKSLYRHGSGHSCLINNHIIHSPGCFVEDGDVQSSCFLAKAFVNSDNNASIFKGNIETNSILYANFDVVGKQFDGTGKFLSSNYTASVIRGTGSQVSTGSFSKTPYAQQGVDFNLQLITDNSDSSFCLQVSNAQNTCFLTRVSLLNIKNTGEQVSTTGTYWTNSVSPTWNNLSNWYSDPFFTTQALYFPSTGSDVKTYGTQGAEVWMDASGGGAYSTDPSVIWVQPHSIDTTNSTDIQGIHFYSETGYIFNGIIYGNAHFYGNIVFK
jgi:hypothetical protein